MHADSVEWLPVGAALAPGRQRLTLFGGVGHHEFPVLCFEYLFPRFSSGFTADWWDVAAYFAGAAAFYVVQEG